jgi:hypothetical protein
MELGIGLLNERDPELIGVCTVTIERCFCLGVEGNTSIHDNVLPAAILEKLEHSETKFKTIIYYQVL